MITDKIIVTSAGEGRGEALLEAEKFARYMGADRKAALKIRLLTEEMLGMVTAITEDFEAEFWLENTKRGGCLLHLSAETYMNSDKKSELIAVSTKRRNEAARGFMGKVREIIENGLYTTNDVMKLSTNYDHGTLMYASMGFDNIESASANVMIYNWSLERYRKSIEDEMGTSMAAEDAWDELEKSIVASIADDVRVSVSGNRVELVIEKKRL